MHGSKGRCDHRIKCKLFFCWLVGQRNIHSEMYRLTLEAGAKILWPKKGGGGDSREWIQGSSDSGEKDQGLSRNRCSSKTCGGRKGDLDGDLGHAKLGCFCSHVFCHVLSRLPPKPLNSLPHLVTYGVTSRGLCL